MCTHRKYVRNPYTGKSIIVSCGKCPACQQEKANKRTQRIKNHAVFGELCIFVTLTYKNCFIPYVKKSELYKSPYSFNIYRDSVSRRNRVSSNYVFSDVVTDGLSVLDNVRLFDSVFTDSDIDTLLSLKNYGSDKVGVIYYPDLQNFFKRLFINLKRKYHVFNKISYFACAEYGPTTYRPHFHLLLFVPSSQEATLRSAIIESWPYGDKYRTAKYIEIAKDASSYVSSYVNRGSCFPKILSVNALRPKHSYSQSFGVRLRCFSLADILEKTFNGSLTYSFNTVRNGLPAVVNLPIPKYVINRYFPYFKGLMRLSFHEISLLLRCPKYFILYKDHDISLTDEDLHIILVRLRNSIERYRFILGYSWDVAVDSYLYDYIKVWSRYHADVMRYFYDSFCDNNFSWHYMYDNIIDLFDSRCNLHSDLDVSQVLNKCDLSYNNNPLIVSQTDVLSDLYDKKLKTRKVVNSVMSFCGHYV